jgi:YggT family protein
MANAGLNAILFLISCIFNFYIIILLVRMMLAWQRADFYHPLTQFVVKLTNPIIKPMKKILPDVGGIETASLLLIFLTAIIKFFFIALLSFGFPNILGLFILAIGDVLRLILQIFTFSILIQAILSWVQPYSPASQMLYKFNSPILRPLHRFIPPVSGFDISPLIALVILQFLNILIAEPLVTLGLSLAAGA